MSPEPSPAQRYVIAAYRSQSRKSGQFRSTCTDREFFVSVQAEILLLDRTVNLKQFFAAIDDALSKERALRSAGHRATTFEDLPERAILMKAIGKAVKDQRLPRPKGEQQPADEVVAPSPEPDAIVEHAENAERMARMAEAAQRAIRHVADPLGRQILRLLFSGEARSQADVARRLGVSEATVSRHLRKALATLRLHFDKSGIP